VQPRGDPIFLKGGSDQIGSEDNCKLWRPKTRENNTKNGERGPTIPSAGKGSILGEDLGNGRQLKERCSMKKIARSITKR